MEKCPKCKGSNLEIVELKGDGDDIPVLRSIECLDCEDNKTPLLTIEIDSINSVPRIYHNGERVEALVTVDFNWKTKSAKRKGGCGFHIKHYALDEFGMPSPNTFGEVRYD